MKALSPGLRHLFAFGSGAGIQVLGEDLEIAVARVRPNGVQVLGRATISRFRERPAAEWGAEYAAFLKKLGASHLSATVLLPRQETIVRQVAMRGVAAKDLEAALAFQLDTISPYGEEEVHFGWTALERGAVLVGVARREIIDRYIELFGEAGIAVGSFTFAAAAIHAAIRLGPPPPAAFLALSRTASGAIEVYGESEARPAFSAEFALPAERAAALASSELRLPPDTTPLALEGLLPAPRGNPVENDLTRNALPYATALAAACPRLAPAANLMPPERRASSSRGIYVLPSICAALLLLAALAALILPGYEERQYLANLNAQIARLEPQAMRAAALDRQTEKARARVRLLSEFRTRTRHDMDAFAELTHLLTPPVWANMVELTPDAVSVNGEAEQAAPLIKILDASPLFHNSEFAGISKVQGAELFRLRLQRRPAK